MTKNNLDSIAFLIPAHNEEAVIASTIKSLLAISKIENIYVIDDGSRDQTLVVAKTYLNNVITISNRGKAKAITHGIKMFKLAKKYKYIMPVDADTVLSKNLSSTVIGIFDSDKDKKIAAVVCKVRGTGTNAITSFRMWEYEISQIIHKSAQGVIDAIIVCPGCSTVYRSEIFKKRHFPAQTLTEDMDLTFTIHRKKLGKIVFTQESEVITQDPKTLKEYIKQIDRWYTGFWMCLIKHKVPWGGQTLDFEVSMLATEGVFNGLLSVFILIGIPVALLINPTILIFPLALDLIIFTIPTLLYMAIKYKMPRIFIYLPVFYVLRIFNSILFLGSFLKTVYGIKNRRKFVWDTARYILEKEEKWAIQPSP